MMEPETRKVVARSLVDTSSKQAYNLDDAGTIGELVVIVGAGHLRFTNLVPVSFACTQCPLVLRPLHPLRHWSYHQQWLENVMW